MVFTDWKIDTIADILPEEFFTLIEKNKNHIQKICDDNNIVK